jgi:hypothetical protein
MTTSNEMYEKEKNLKIYRNFILMGFFWIFLFFLFYSYFSFSAKVKIYSYFLYPFQMRLFNFLKYFWRASVCWPVATRLLTSPIYNFLGMSGFEPRVLQ